MNAKNRAARERLFFKLVNSTSKDFTQSAPPQLAYGAIEFDYYIITLPALLMLVSCALFVVLK